jgi:protein-tyrosine phosphatase
MSLFNKFWLPWITPMKLLARTLTLLLVIAVAACSSGDASLPPQQRPLASEQALELRADYRKLPFEGANNFRDLGGYKTADGKAVKWGVIYRSDKLSNLSDDDLAFMERLGLQQVVDLRTEFEKSKDPDRLPANTGINYVERPLDVEGTAIQEMFDKILSGDVEGLDIDNMLVEANRDFVLNNLEPFREHVHSLLDPSNLPSVAHCTGGKDRAGMAAALTLLSLGVPKETVIDDYMLTNVYTEDYINRTLWVIRFASLFRTDPEDIRPLLGVERRYIEAAFDAIEQRYGSIDNFIREGLELDEAQLVQLRTNLLEN